MEKHAIEADGRGGYQVRFSGADGDSYRVIAGFPTWKSAYDWLDEHLGRTGGIAPDPADP
jgi:hypothetical protein